MATSTLRAELRDFLRTRRRGVSPEQAGIAVGPRRRVAGLRREELAARAGVGVTWYTWLEQGRDIRVSPETLSRIAAALELSASDTAYLFTLCDLPAPVTRVPSSPTAIPAPVIDVLNNFFGPALVLGPASDILSANAFAEELYELASYDGPFARNLLVRALTDPDRRRFYVDFDGSVQQGIGNLIGFIRMNYARHIGEPHFEAVLSHLKTNEQFVNVWDEQRTVVPSPWLLRLDSKQFGRVTFHSVRFLMPALPDHLVALLPPADAGTREVIARWMDAKQRSLLP